MIRRLLVIGLLLLPCAWAETRVLVLHSHNEFVPFTRQVNEQLFDQTNPDIQYYLEYFDVQRFGAKPDQFWLTNLQQKYQLSDFEIVVGISNYAESFLYQNRAAFADIPLAIYSGTLDLNITAPDVLLTPNYTTAVTKTLQLAMRQNPQANQMIVVDTGSSQAVQLLRALAEQTLPESLKVTVLQNFSLQELLTEISTFSGKGFILYPPMFTDRLGQQYLPRDVLTRLTSVSALPVYVNYTTLFMDGVIGGNVLDPNAIGMSVVNIAQDVENKLPIVRENYTVMASYVSATESKKFGLPYEQMDATIINKPIPLTERFNREIIFLLISAALIIFITFFWALRQRTLRGKLETRNALLQRLKTQLNDANQQLTHLAMHDSLTSLYNRHAMESLLFTAEHRLRRYGESFSLLIIDIDDFKQVNDQFGHNVGDDVLVATSKTMLNRIRESDAAARWGGDEFLVLLPHTGKHQAELIARALLDNVEDSQLIADSRISISIGIAQSLQNEAWKETFSRADQALLGIKNSGKNNIAFASEGDSQQNIQQLY